MKIYLKKNSYKKILIYFRSIFKLLLKKKTHRKKLIYVTNNFFQSNVFLSQKYSFILEKKTQIGTSIKKMMLW